MEERPAVPWYYGPVVMICFIAMPLLAVSGQGSVTAGFTAAVIFSFVLPRWAGWARVWPWALAAFGVTFAALTVIGDVLGVLSTVWGVAYRVDLPWGLVWATDGVKGEGVGFEFGSGFGLTPAIAVIAVALVRGGIVLGRAR